MSAKRKVGRVIKIAGVALIAFGIYHVATTPFEIAAVPSLVANGFAFMMYGVVALIVGVAVSGYRNRIALILHLAAVVPFYYAIRGVIAVGQTGTMEVSAYIRATQIIWMVGFALTMLGVVANRERFWKRIPEPEPEPVAAMDPFEPPPAG